MRREPKKSETIEIRVPWETKKAFMAACHANGSSASFVLRAFIDRYLRSASPLSSGWRKELAMLFVEPRRRLAAASIGALGAAVTFAAFAGPARAATDARVQAVFEWMDANHDGMLSAAEFAGPPQDGDPGAAGMELIVDSKAPPPPNESRAALFRRLDLNGDGRLSLGEVASGSVVRTIATPMIAGADSNHDGMITEGELAAFMTARRAAAGAANPSAGAGLMAHGIIAAADTDHDGKVAIADLSR